VDLSKADSAAGVEKDSLGGGIMYNNGMQRREKESRF
jgi:hypothetical protein